MNTMNVKVLGLFDSLGSGAQARVCKLILQEALAEISDEGPCELWLENRPEHGWIQTIKAVRAIAGMGLKEAKDVVDGAAVAPQLVCKCDTKPDAVGLAKELTAAGARYSIREAK